LAAQKRTQIIGWEIILKRKEVRIKAIKGMIEL
jgi:hypothetical protein